MNKIMSKPYFTFFVTMSLTFACGHQNSHKDPKKSSEAPQAQNVGEAENSSTSQFSTYGTELSNLVAKGNSVEVPYYVVLGGNLSCDRSLSSKGHESPYESHMYKKFEKSFLDTFKNSMHPLHYLVSCYSKRRNVFYSTSLEPKEILPASEQTLRDVVLQQTLPNQRIIIVGHSYGGWLAMQLAADLLSQRQVVGLFTIDPISPLQCTVKNTAGCTLPPLDLGPGTLQMMAQSVGTWENFFQEQTKSLHSGPIQEARVNTLINASHMKIPNDPSIWQRVFSVDTPLAVGFGNNNGNQSYY